MRTKTTRPITAVLVALTVAGVLGACSGGSGSGDGDDDVATLSDDDTNEQAQADSTDDGEAELLDWVECMRGEGIDIPDPTRDADGNLVINGNGITIGGGDEGGASGIDEPDEGEEPPFDPEEMDAATEVCGPPPAVGGEMSEEDLQEAQDAALEFAECMRNEGIEDFPDPDFSDTGPGSGPQTNSNSGDGGGGPVVAGPFGEIDLDDSETAAAFEACQDLIGPPGGEGGAGEAPELPAEGSS